MNYSTPSLRILTLSAILVAGIPIHSNPTRWLQRPGGRIAWTLHGDHGPLVVCMPGMGDLRQGYDAFADSLVRRGWKVAVMDLRGHGQSDTGFGDVTSRAISLDALALADSLDTGKVVFLGNSYTGASAVWAATDRPGKVSAIVLVDPFVREIPPTFLQKLTMAVGLVRPWGPSLWGSYYRSLFVDHPPLDLDARVQRVVANLKERGRFETLNSMLRTPVAPCEARLPQVRVPALVVMGAKDPDFPDPKAEATTVASRIHGSTFLVPGAGHYPYAEQPGLVATRIDAFVRAQVAAP